MYYFYLIKIDIFEILCYNLDMEKQEKIIALDLSTKSTGLAFYIGKELKDYRCIKASSDNLISRIKKITIDLKEYLHTNLDVDTIVLEEVIPDPEKNILTFKALTWIHAAENFLFYELVPKAHIVYIYPSAWRKICGIKTGKGIKRLELKREDVKLANKLYNLSLTTDQDDEADAILLGHAYLHRFEEINWE